MTVWQLYRHALSCSLLPVGTSFQEHAHWLWNDTNIDINFSQSIDSGLAQTSVFPFRKLPLEIREKVFGKVIGNVRWPIHRKNRVAIVGFCSCPKPTSSPWEATKLNLHLARTSKEMYSEMMAYLFKSTTINFNCSCEMVKTIGEHKVLQENVRSIQYHWVGPTSDKAFLKLAGCPNLRSLELIVSRSTLRWIDEDEMEMAKYFGPRQSLRVTESLGFSELIRIRGLLNVRVGHTGAKTADKIQESQRSGLESLLRDRLRQ